MRRLRVGGQVIGKYPGASRFFPARILCAGLSFIAGKLGRLFPLFWPGPLRISGKSQQARHKTGWPPVNFFVKVNRFDGSKLIFDFLFLPAPAEPDRIFNFDLESILFLIFHRGQGQRARGLIRIGGQETG